MQLSTKSNSGYRVSANPKSLTHPPTRTDKSLSSRTFHFADKLDNPMPTFRPKDLMVSVGESARFYCEAFVGNLYLPDATNEIVWSQMFDDHPHNVSDSMQVNVTR